MMAVLAGNRGGQARDKTPPGAPCTSSKTSGGQVVALVNDDVTVGCHAILDDPFPHQTLDESHIDLPR